MSPDRHSLRFDPRWRLRPIGTDGADLFEASLLSETDAWGDGAAGQQFDEALEEIATCGCRVCPLCGAIVARSGSFEV